MFGGTVLIARLTSIGSAMSGTRMTGLRFSATIIILSDCIGEFVF